jgi:hypothetical protein
MPAVAGMGVSSGSTKYTGLRSCCCSRNVENVVESADVAGVDGGEGELSGVRSGSEIGDGQVTRSVKQGDTSVRFQPKCQRGRV